MSKNSNKLIQDGIAILGSLVGITISVAAMILKEDNKNRDNKAINRKHHDEYISYRDSKVIKEIDYIYHADELYTSMKPKFSFRFSFSHQVLYNYILISLKEQNTNRMEILLDRYDVNSYDKRMILRETDFYIRYDLNK